MTTTQAKDWVQCTYNDQQLAWHNEHDDRFVTITNRFQSGDIHNKWKLYVEDTDGKVIHNSGNAYTRSQALELARRYMEEGNMF